MTRTPIEPNSVVDAIKADRSALVDEIASKYLTLPEPGYALPMAWRCAVETSNHLVDAVPRYSSADHGSVFKSLIAVACKMLSAPGAVFQGPYFDSTLDLDETIQDLLTSEFSLLSQTNLAVSLQEGYWRLVYDQDKDAFHLTLAPPQRRSALSLLDHKVEFLNMAPEVHQLIQGEPSGEKGIQLVLATGMEHVIFLRDAVPHAWQRLSNDIGFTLDNAVRFLSFVQSLMVAGHLWFQRDDLLEGFRSFSEERALAPIDGQSFHQMVDFFSAAPEDIAKWGIAVPFIKLGEWFAYWPFTHHVLPPSLSFLALLMRKHPDAWNNTVGSDLADVAKTIRKQLPDLPGLLFATMKKRSGVGDIDLAIYDARTRVLMLCEIKTVFDRFRTNYQLSNFKDQRVCFAKAAGQLSSAMESITSGAWALSDIFGKTLDGPPAQILPIVLTWYDQLNPWIGAPVSYPSSCNFRVFRYLFTQAAGDLEALHQSIKQLSRIYCVASLHNWRVPARGETIEVRRQVQTDLLPTMEHLNAMPLCSIVKREVESLIHLPADWVAQAAGCSQSPDDYHIYAFDEP